mgnify:FL=1
MVPTGGTDSLVYQTAAHNAWRVRRVIEATRRTTFGRPLDKVRRFVHILVDKKDAELEEVHAAISQTIVWTPHRPQAVKPHIGVVLLGKLQPPFLSGWVEEVGVGSVAWPHFADDGLVLIGVHYEYSVGDALVINWVAGFVGNARILKQHQLMR